MLALAGCASPAATASGSPSVSPTKKSAAIEFCSVLVPGLSDYADYILDASKGNVNTSTNDKITGYLTQLRGLAPDSLKTEVDDFAGPGDAINEVVERGGGALNFNTDAYKAANAPLLAYCNGAGYKA